MNNLVIHDTLEAFINDKDNDKTHFFGLTTGSNVSQSIDQEPIRAGIGNRICANIQSNKAIEFSITTGFHNDDIFAIQSGTTFQNGTIVVPKSESAKLVSGAFEINGNPIDDEVIVIDKYGKELVAICLDGEVTVTGGTDGEIHTAIYSESVTGEILDLNSEKFPKNYQVTLHGIAFDPDSNEIIADIYWIFDKAAPDGNINADYKAGENKTDEVKFTAQTMIGESSYGKYVVVPRV